MKLEDYHAFTRELVSRLENDDRVIGLIAAGSMAEQGTIPDEWSDHDFWIVVKTGCQESFRTDLSWLPVPSPILLHYRETAHGLKAVYGNGHLVEFAVFDTEELQLARVNRYRVLIDRGGIAPILTMLETRTQSEFAEATNEFLIGQFLTGMLVASARYHRGEKLSGWNFLINVALRNLLQLYSQNVKTASDYRDNIDPFRRFEFSYKNDAIRIEEALRQQELPEICKHLLLLYRDRFQDTLPEYDDDIVSVLLQKLLTSSSA